MIARRTDALLGAGFVVLWSSGFIGAELGARSAPASTLLAWRFITAVPVLALWFAWRRPRVPRRDLALHVLIGLLGQGGYLYGVFEASQQGVDAGVSSLVAALQPLVAVALAVPLLGESITRRQFAGFAGGLAGVALVVGGEMGGGAPAWAYLLPFGAMLSLVAATLVERRARPSVGVMEALSIQAAVSAVLFSGLAAAEGALVPPAEPDFWAAVAVLVVLAMFGGYGLYWVNVRRTGVARVSALLYLTPPTTMIGGWALFGSTLRPLSLLGVLVCAAAVATALRPPRESGRGQARSRRPFGVGWKPADSNADASGDPAIAAPSARSTVSLPSAPSRTASASASTAGCRTPESSSQVSSVRPPRST
ncbi:drug/metabolite transporter (DMT)-like permease [Actinomadura algeriensis]|uniref:Drug/metabolite transporter (DMT)-like permease n=1 Tax=Actinomadura algeriensis TaxID=1679523 RepID=A0ABR9JX18_9ACTN|nr:drug/metabolite transporter (DMT)-like permease [Actinomadura algeriensis]